MLVVASKACPLCGEELLELSPHNWVHAFQLIPSELSRTQLQKAS